MRLVQLDLLVHHLRLRDPLALLVLRVHKAQRLLLRAPLAQQGLLVQQDRHQAWRVQQAQQAQRGLLGRRAAPLVAGAIRSSGTTGKP